MKVDGTVVLVTGASGFLGQHVVKMLQTRGGHVTEIRAFDVVPFIKQLDYEQVKPVHAIVGSITDVGALYKAFQGVDCVMHLASLIDITMFPDEKRLFKINVEGTRNVIDACRKCNVPRLVYCSSNAVVRGMDHLYNATESDTSAPDSFLLQVYGNTKKLAEDLVLQAKSEELSTICLRPTGMYGDLERLYTPAIGNSVLSKKLGYFVSLDCIARADHCYVGNCAWAFVCADLALQGSRSKLVSGNAFFIRDETPLASASELMTDIAEEAGLKPFPIKIPVWFLMILHFLLYHILKPISRFCVINIKLNKGAIQNMETVFHCSYDKAKTLLGYQPIFDFEEAKRLTASYILKLKKENT